MKWLFDTRPNALATSILLQYPQLQQRLPRSQRNVVDRASSQYHEWMNHLAAFQRENRGGESCIVAYFAAVSYDRR